MNYTVFDVETANCQRDSICSIGIIRYESGKVIFEKEILINPEVEFNYFNTRIHGITQEDVEDAKEGSVFEGVFVHSASPVKYEKKKLVILDDCVDREALNRIDGTYNMNEVNSASDDDPETAP